MLKLRRLKKVVYLKSLEIFFLLVLVSCAGHYAPTINKTTGMAQDSLNTGKVSASATRTKNNLDVCFNISLELSGVTQQDAMPNNWSLAWIDNKNHYHLLTLNQRDPATTPATTKAPDHFRNSFQTCAAGAALEDVKTLVLTPKDLPFEDKRSLKLSW